MADDEKKYARNIVVCSDGTGNAGGRGQGSNVWRIRQAVAQHSAEKYNTQIVLYEEGVGTQTIAPVRLLGNAFSLGMKQDLRLLYGKLIREFRAEKHNGNDQVYHDQLYLFGFSRGAFAIRTLANLLYHCGIADRNNSDGTRRTPEELDEIADAALDAYARRVWHPKAPEEFRKAFGISWTPPETSGLTMEEAKGRFPIKFIGVWDTVDAVGLPFDNVTQFLTDWGCPGFRLNLRRRGDDYLAWEDDDLHDWIENAYHAISVDDERDTFHPVLWLEFDENANRKADTPAILFRKEAKDTEAKGEEWDGPRRKVEQVWFPGVHSNIGGGYPKDHLAYVSLNWMMRHASREGLKFDRQLWNEYRQECDELGHMYDSREGLGAMYRYKPRSVGDISREVGLDASSDERKPLIHASVFRRIIEGATDYAPIGIPLEDEYCEVDNPKNLTNRAGMRKNANSDVDIREFDTASDRHEERPAAKLCGVRRKAIFTTRRLVAWRTCLFYAFYTWVISFIVVGFGLSRMGSSRGQWFESQGNEYYWLPFWMSFAVAGLIAAGIQFLNRPVKKEIVTVKTGYNIARIVKDVCFLSAILIALRPLCVNVILWAVPGVVAPVISGIAESTIAFTSFCVAFYLISAGRMATQQLLTEVNVWGWMNALNIPAARRRSTAWLKMTSITQWPVFRQVGWFFGSVVSPVSGLTVVGLIVLAALVSSFRGVVTNSNVSADKSASYHEVTSLSGGTDSARRKFITSQILATGVHLKEGWEYRVTVAGDSDWQDSSLPATSAGLKKPVDYGDESTEWFMRNGDFLKRKPGEDYFQLLGSIGDPAAVSIVIHSGQSFTATNSGELFLYVNDLPGFYRNNKGDGSVTIEVVRR